jgi:hypothetical protein
MTSLAAKLTARLRMLTREPAGRIEAGAGRLSASQPCPGEGRPQALRRWASDLREDFMTETAACKRSAAASGLGRTAVACAIVAVLLGLQPAGAEEMGATRIMKAMSDYVGSQKTISLTFDSDIEVVTPELQKVQFASSGKLLLSRPDKLRVTRTGGYANVELLFDGKTVIIYGKNLDVFAQIDVPGATTDDLVDRLRSGYAFDAPGTDLLLTSSFETLMADVIDVKHIGHGVVDGVECEHLAFRNEDVDWQLWVEAGPRPIPRKYVITSKTVAGAPQYTLTIRNWQSEIPGGAEAFAFKPEVAVRRVEPRELTNLDEVPEGRPMGGSK